jgi:hypothetical protein
VIRANTLNAMLRPIPTSFANADGDRAPRPLVLRHELDETRANEALDLIAQHDWDRLRDAYGPATDVPAQLAAIVVGDDPTRERAWWNLWGNIWHQGTIYGATVPAVAVLAAIARWHAHPDRVQAIVLLREIADGEGSSKAAVDAALAGVLSPLCSQWAAEPELVKRALLWLVSACATLRAAHPDLVDAVLPDEHRDAWNVIVGRGWETDDEYDAFCEFEAWATEGAS